MAGLRILCTLVLGLLPTLTVAQAAPDGAAIYKQRCQVCHGATGAKPTSLGPSLSDVVGRAAASTTFTYSPALKASKIVWTRANLDKFLSGPPKMVPGTRMAVVLSDSKQRASVVSYLAKTK